jgi:hypothetical protein
VVICPDSSDDVLSLPIGIGIVIRKVAGGQGTSRYNEGRAVQGWVRQDWVRQDELGRAV